MDTLALRSARAASAAAIVASLCGCTQLLVRADWDEKPAWEPLTPVLFEVEPSRLADNCPVVLPPGQTLYGCARRDYSIGACLIFTGPHPESWLLEHERKHCAGWDHGSSTPPRQ